VSKLPHGWCASQIGQLGVWRGGGTPSKAETSFWTNGEIPWVSPKDMKRDYIDDAEDRITSAAVAASATQIIPKGSVLLVIRSGILRHSLPIAIATRDLAINQDLKALTPYDGVEAEFIGFQLRLFAQEILSQCAKSGTTVDSVDFDKLKAFSVRLCPLDEQRRIVAKIKSLSTKSTRARNQLDYIPRLVEKYKQAILAAAFRGQLTREWRARHSSESWSQQELGQLAQRRNVYLEQRRGSRLISDQIDLGQLAPLPQGWFAAILADVGDLQVGYAYKSKWYSKEGIRLLRGVNVAPGRVIWDDEVRLPTALAEDYSQYTLNLGDIVIAMDRPMISTGLKVARITQADVSSLLVQRVARYAVSEFVDGDFIWHFINSRSFIDHSVSKSTGSDLPHISSNDILTTPMPLPSLAEQREIVRCIEMALGWINRLASEATNARKLIDHLDQAVLTKAFTGELLPQDPGEEPTSVLLDRIREQQLSRATSNSRRPGQGQRARKVT
jgi:type I restriction enzyme, S subunit